MPSIQRPGGLAIHYELDDFTDPWKNAPYIFLQHGVGRTSRLWYGWVPYLSRFFKVVRTDLRGAGRSGDVQATSLDDYLGDILAVADHLGAESFHYGGDSMGGILGMMLAAAQPARVRTLTLLSSPVYLDEHNLGAVSLGRPSVHAALDELGAMGWAQAMHDGVLMERESNPALADWFAQEMGSSRLETLHTMFRLAIGADATPILPKINAPVLAFYPTRGTLTSNRQEQLLRQHVRDLKYIRLAAPHHSAQHVAPASCALQLLHFASQADGSTCHE